MGYNQEETSLHDGVEGWAQQQSRVARGIYCQEYLCNEGTCGGQKAPHRRGLLLYRSLGVGGGVLGLALAYILVLGLSFRTLLLFICIYCPCGTVINPILSPPCLKPSWSPFHFLTTLIYLLYLWSHPNILGSLPILMGPLCSLPPDSY